MAAEGTVAEGARLDVEVSSDEADPNAREIMLESVQLVESPSMLTDEQLPRIGLSPYEISSWRCLLFGQIELW